MKKTYQKPQSAVIDLMLENAVNANIVASSTTVVGNENEVRSIPHDIKPQSEFPWEN